MTYVKTVEPQKAAEPLKSIYEAVHKNMGVVPSFVKAMGDRPDVIEAFLPLYQRLINEQHKLNQATKELMICYVSIINSCEY